MSYPIRTIVAGIASLTEGDPCLAPAVELAERTGADLHVVHAFESPAVFATFPTFEPINPDAAIRYAEELQAQLGAVVRGITSSPSVHWRAVAASPGAALVSVADEVGADLVVMGPTHRGSIGSAILGTTAQRVIRSSRVPVLLLRHALPRVVGRVVLTTDLSELSASVHEKALDVVEALLAPAALEVRSLLVVSHGALPPPLPVDVLERAGETELDTFLGKRRVRDQPILPVVRIGEASYEIAAEAREWNADLLVLGTHGRKGAERFFLGSVAEMVLRTAPCDVLVVPVRTGAAEGARSAPAAAAGRHA